MKYTSTPTNAGSRKEAEEQEMTRQWIDFYRFPDKLISGQRWTLGRILAMRDQELEKHHDFIQLLFPNKAPSGPNPRAPLLTDAMIQVTPLIKKNIDKALKKVLNYWGIFWAGGDAGIVLESAKKEKVSKWCQDNSDESHNQLRVTRVLNFLMAIGQQELALELEAKMNHHRKKEGVSFNMHWAEAVGRIDPD